MPLCIRIACLSTPMFRFRFLPILPARLNHFDALPLSNLVRFCKRMTTEPFIDKRIPDKWRDYKACGVPIKGERIIAFKTPLSNKYNNESDQDNGIKPFERFTPMDLLNRLKQNNLKLGLVVDFTNTFRYYDGWEFSHHGILYQKIKCVGKEIPSEDVVKRFKAEACSFLSNNATTDLIGVHCTHGLNRAGYIVCRYLIECRGFTPELAIEAFNEARGYPMERENYLKDLKTKTPKFEDLSNIRKGDRRRKRASPPDRPRFFHTNTDSFSRRGTAGGDVDRMGRCPSTNYRRQNDDFDFDSNYSDNRYGPRHSNTRTRDHTTGMSSGRDRRDNYRGYRNGYEEDYHNYDYSYHGYTNYANYDYHDHRPRRNPEGFYRRDHKMRNKQYAPRDRSAPYAPYSRQRTR